MTGLASCSPCVDAALWVDEFIISTQDIAAPGAAAGSSSSSSVISGKAVFSGKVVVQ
jgi:hypothetical protein